MINMPLTGSAMCFQVDNVARINLGQLETTTHGDVVATGHLSNANGGGSVDLSECQITRVGVPNGIWHEKLRGLWVRGTIQ